MADPHGQESQAAAILSAHWSRTLASADAARARGQSGFTVASAIATALVAAGIFSNISDRAHPARYVGGVALALWLGAMLLFLLVVASSTGGGAEEYEGGLNEGDIAGFLLESVDDERRTVERRLRRAVVVTSVAVVVTAATLVIGTTSLSVDQDNGRLVLTARGLSALNGLCDTNPPELHGTLDVPTLRHDFVLFRIDKGGCRAGRKTPVRVPRQEVLAFLEDSGT